jgi:hypothetical protein
MQGTYRSREVGLSGTTTGHLRLNIVVREGHALDSIDHEKKQAFCQ